MRVKTNMKDENKRKMKKLQKIRSYIVKVKKKMDGIKNEEENLKKNE